MGYMVGMKHVQLMHLGFHLGHIFKISKFLVRWMLHLRGLFYNMLGLETLELKFEIFLINLNLTILGLRSLFEFGKGLGLLNKRVWFICHNYYFSPLVARYASAAGTGYSTFDWIAGSLTNMKNIFIYLYSIYVDWVKGFKTMQRHKVFLFRLWGFGLSSFIKPFFIIFPRLFEAKIASYEIGGSNVISAGLVDSNMLGNHVRLPLAGNDDSVSCVNFLCFYFSKHMIGLKMNALLKWPTNVKRKSRNSKLLTFIYILFVYFTGDWLSTSKKYFEWILSKFGWSDLSYQVKFLFETLKPTVAFVSYVGGGGLFKVSLW